VKVEVSFMSLHIIMEEQSLSSVLLYVGSKNDPLVNSFFLEKCMSMIFELLPYIHRDFS